MLFVNSFSFAQSKEDDLKEANRISDLFFGKVFHSCNWGMVLGKFRYKVDTISVKNQNDTVSLNWLFSYESGFTGNKYVLT